MKRRASGILLHISSLPSEYGIGDFGPAAYHFVDLLAEAKQSYWQILPLNPTESFYDNSPYRSMSAFALNPLFISPDFLVEEGLLDKTEIEAPPEAAEGSVNFDAVTSFNMRCLERAFERFKKQTNRCEYDGFCRRNSYWLEDYVLFVALKSKLSNEGWNTWPRELAERNGEALSKARAEFTELIALNRFLQFTAEKQWLSLKNYANEKGVHIIGDIPIYVDYDSADVWTNQEIFKLDEHKKPYAVAGVPPDYFSETGQLWGNPLYRWEVMKERGFDWWCRRISRNLNLFNIVRIDHFRGLVAYWEIPADSETAIEGKWVEVPTKDFVHALLKIDPFLPIMAEDLGVITPDVREIIKEFALPGMNVLQFAFDSDTATNPHIPHNVAENRVIYTGTHDNNTVKGWFEHDAPDVTKKRLYEYIGRNVSADELPWEMIRLAMMSRANTAIVSMQDLLGLGEEARMNTPSTVGGNWKWRLSSEQLQTLDTEKLARMTAIYGRY
jgi:4-alpha-glucanotransferase